jgi:hypothetical protein
MEYGYKVGRGNNSRVFNATFLATYELRENLFIDFSTQVRTVKMESGYKDNTAVISTGIRWNMARRVFDF